MRPQKKLQISDAERLLASTLRDLEARNLIIDPFTVSAASLTIAVLGAVPFSFTQRTGEGDDKYLQVKALLWEFESLSEGEKREVRFHLFMDKAIDHLKKHLRLLVQQGSGDQSKGV